MNGTLNGVKTIPQNRLGVCNPYPMKKNTNMEAGVRVQLNITQQSDKKKHHSVTWNMLFSVFLLVGWKNSCYSFKTTTNCSPPLHLL